MPICIECSYPVSQLYHVLHSRNHTKPPPLPPKPKPAYASSSLSKKTGSKSTGSLRGLHESVRASFRGSDSRTSDGSETQKDEAAAAKNKKSKEGAGVGTDVRLMQCPRCKRFADKYVEHDFVVLFIDLVLVKPQVYRHLLFNRLHTTSDALDRSILRLALMLLLFEVYITIAHMEGLPSEVTSRSRLTGVPTVLQYLFFLFLCFATTLAQHLTIRWLAGWTGLGSNGVDADGMSSQGNSPTLNVQYHQKEGGGGASGAATPGILPPPAQASPPKPATPNAISTALVVSSCMSLFPLLMLVWKYDDSSSSALSSTTDPPAPSAATLNSSSIDLATGSLSPSAGHGMNWVRTGVAAMVAVQNWEALRILLRCGYFGAAGLVVAGVVVRWAVRAVILAAVGLGEAG